MLKRIIRNLIRSAPVRSQAGFSLIELMIVIAIMALLGTFVGAQVMKRYDEAKVNASKIQIRQLGTALDDFRRVCGFYPTTEQGLEALVKAPMGRECKGYDPEGFIKGGKLPQDPWNTPFVYESDGNKYKIVSLGRDKAQGGNGFDTDIDSDNLE